MRNLIVWQLSDSIKLSIGTITQDLQTITCCDFVDIVLYHDAEVYPLLVGFPACDLQKFSLYLKQVIAQPYESFFFCDALKMIQDRCGFILFEFYMRGQLIHFSVQHFSIVKSWIKQLELLHVLMAENEQEKKTRSTGCCGA